MAIKIRAETPADVPAIHAVTVAAFLHAEHTSHTEQHIVDDLRKAGALTLSLLAEDDGKVVGHVVVSPVSIADGATGWFGLGPISVDPAFQKQGIGSQLMHEALNQLRQRDAAGCVVFGYPRYYERFGFKPEPTLVLPEMPPEYFLAITFGPALPCGSVSYHDAFAA